MKILMLSIATGKYDRFIDPLYQSIQQNFLKNHDISFLLFTDKPCEELKEKYPLKTCHIEHKPFPEPTLKRYNYFMLEREYIESFDYVFYSDADMLFVQPISDEILSDNVIVTQHIMMSNPKTEWTYERRSESTAYIPEGQGNVYVAGGFNGGKSEKFMSMAETISENVLEDERNGIMAVWHDESHLNHYVNVKHPEFMFLPLHYCCPDNLTLTPEPAKIIALTKNHEEVRSA
jgi:hypothetical protein